jgi:flagellar L-ring protein FlgH
MSDRQPSQRWRSFAMTTVAMTLVIAAMVVAGRVPAFAQEQAQANPAAVDPGASTLPSDVYDTLYARYLDSARRTTPPPNGVSIDWMVGLGLDPRARHVNDLVTIQVIEKIEASGTADAQLNKNSSGSASVSKLFGVETKLPSMVDPTNLVAAATDTKFKGGGVTSRTGDLTAMLTARVIEILPNGDLVLEGAREIEINGDRQMVVLTGVVRQSDIGKNNVVLSPAIGQLRIRYFGRGLMKDNLKPGFLVRLLNRIF